MSRKNKKIVRKKGILSHLRLLVLPIRDNDYQPYLVRRHGLVLVVMLLVGIQVFYNMSQTGSVLGDRANVSMEALLEQTNKARQSNDLGALTINQKLNKAAYLKAKDMLDKEYWGHVSPDGTEPWYWFSEAEYNYLKAGENLARNFHTAEAVNTAWMESPDHRRNILEPDYTEVGYAIASGTIKGESTTIIVALYGRPIAAGVASTNMMVASAQSGSLNILTRIGIGLQSATPAVLGSIVVMTFLMMIAFMAHLYRDSIPVSSQHPRHRHNHGAIKVGLMLALIVAMLLLYGGGQI